MRGIVAALLLILLQSSSAQGQYRFYLYEKTDKAGIAPWMRYNKVDGAFLGLGGYWRPFGSFTLSGSAGYGFSQKDPRYQVAARQSWVLGNTEWAVTADYSDLTVSNDTAVISDWQNSLTSLLLRQDYYNHYRVRGPRLRLGADLHGTYRWMVAVGMHTYSSLDNTTRYSFTDWKATRVNGRKSFSPNPHVVEGDDYFFQAGYEIDFRPSPMAFVSAWYFQGSYTNSRLLHGTTGSDFSYQKLSMVFRRYQQVFRRQRMAVGLRVGSYQGNTSTDSSSADQFLFDAGGYGTLRGYRYREFVDGNRMVLLSADYFFNGSFLPKTFLARTWGLKAVFRTFDLLFFADAGQIWLTGVKKNPFSPSGFKTDKLAVDAGVGLGMGDWIRFECAFPLKSTATTRVGNPILYMKIARKL